MNLKAKAYLEDDKKAAEGKLAARLALLKEKGVDGATVEREPSVRKIKAEIRKTNRRLAGVAAAERRNEERARRKAERLAAKDAPAEAPAPEPVEEAPRKEKKKKKKGTESGE